VAISLGKNVENPYNGNSMDLDWNRMDFFILHNNCICPYYGYSIEIEWINYGFSGAIATIIV
jgi:hypothetical protein